MDLFFVAILILSSGLNVVASQKNNVLMEKCCSLGGSLSVDGKDCRRIELPIPGVSQLDQITCRSVAEFCCDRERLHLDCKYGEIFATTYDHCKLDNKTQACNGQAESCCSACLLARTLTQAGLECNVPGLEDVTLTQVFRRCCPKNTVSDDDDQKDYDSMEPPTNLCEILPGQLCAQTCIPTPNSYYCQCEEGYTLMEDQKSCQPDKSKVKQSGPVAPPMPNPEKPVPLKKITPYPVPPLNKAKCSEGTNCEHECRDSSLGQICACRPGYELHPDRNRCLDIDECLDNVHVCDPSLEVCHNEVGGYRCEPRPTSTETATPVTSHHPPPTTPTTQRVYTTPARIVSTLRSSTDEKRCIDGYEMQGGHCVDVDECDTTKRPEVCEPKEVCLNTQGSYECRCQAGFQKEVRNGPCLDVNECQTNLHRCGPEQRCDNTIGSYVCHRTAGCGTGYTLNANSGDCEDDDECLLQTDNCRFLGGHGVRFECKNTQGSFRCEVAHCREGELNCTALCPRGYQHVAARKTCVDIDECQQNMHNCNPQTELCVNRRGGFDCRRKPSCPRGYDSTSHGCQDIDECTTGAHNCDTNSICRNHPGGFSCYCHSGYQKNGNHCEDIDECSRYGCPASAECQNSPGSYRCICKPGYRQDGTNHCLDENECETPGMCDHHCINVYGSFRCSCKNGFVLSENNRTCSDIDECERFKSQHLCLGRCVNTPGSFECSCPAGYTLGADQRTCQDIDECLRNPCRGPDEVCLNTGGSYACNSIACPPGYQKDLYQKNRCTLSPCNEPVHICLQKPRTISYNFITFVSMLHIPSVGYLDLFALRGPPGSEINANFDLQLKNVDARSDVTAATINDFRLRYPGAGQAVLALRRSIPGPQRIELELTASIHRSGVFTGVMAVAKLNIHVSQYEY